MTKRKTPEHRAEMEARAVRRTARSDRQRQRAANRVAIREVVNRITHNERMALLGQGRRNSVTPPRQDGEHD